MGGAADRPSQATCLIFRRPACCPLIGQPIFRAPLDNPAGCALPEAPAVAQPRAKDGAGTANVSSRGRPVAPAPGERRSRELPCTWQPRLHGSPVVTSGHISGPPNLTPPNLTP